MTTLTLHDAMTSPDARNDKDVVDGNENIDAHDDVHDVVPPSKTP